jgi:UDPglucose--hexose-1-phosphate uridylyltransferase
MPYNELRKDYLLDRWVVIATERARRPTDFSKPRADGAKNSVCPMCTGNEQMTPPAVMLYLKEDGKITKAADPAVGTRPKNWAVRVIPNLFPAFSPPKEPNDVTEIFENENLGCAIGAHEVIVESPNHDEDPADASLPQLELLIQAYIERLRDLTQKPYVKYVSIFRNFGLEAGASLSHAHSQVIATPTVPTNVAEELDASKKYYQKNGTCPFCDIIRKESASPRLIFQDDDFVVLAPYASIVPIEFWIIPKKHASNILNLSSEEVLAFAKTLKASLKALKDLVNDPPYNYGLHLSLDEESRGYYHWHLEVYPKLAVWAGFELNTGMYINTVTPESAAAELKKKLNP